MDCSISSTPSNDEEAREVVDHYKLVARDGVLGFERASGFECVTNFVINVCGYVADDGQVMGYVLNLDLAVTDPQNDGAVHNK